MLSECFKRKVKNRINNGEVIQIMLIGNIASGKTTIRNEIVEAFPDDFVVLSRDQVAMGYAQEYGISYQDTFLDKNHDQRVTQRFNDRVNEAFSERKNVIWDLTNLKPSERKERLSNNPHSYNVGIFMDTPLEECIRRSASREEDKIKQMPESIIRAKANDYSVSSEGFDLCYRIDSKGMHSVECKLI